MRVAAGGVVGGKRFAPEDLVDFDGFGAAFEFHGGQRTAGKFAVEMGVGGGGDDDLAGAGLGTEAGGDVDGIAEGSVLHAALGAEIADDGFAGVNADADVEGRLAGVFVELVEAALHAGGGADGGFGVVL